MILKYRDLKWRMQFPPIRDILFGVLGLWGVGGLLVGMILMIIGGVIQHFALATAGGIAFGSAGVSLITFVIITDDGEW